MPEKFIYIESTMEPLAEVPYGDLKANMKDPVTGKPYKGIVLEGVFADLNPVENRNKRIYDIPTYLEKLRELKQQIHTSKGVYGELEHPDNYSVNFNNVSHKLLDVWYEEDTKLVKGRVILLNTVKGKIAQEIIRSGGQLAISARAGGDAVDMGNGTVAAYVGVITTYDLVYRPGFAGAVLEFKELNESERFIQNKAQNITGFSMILTAKDLKKINESYARYINIENLNETESLERRSKCFLQWLSESEQDKQQQQMLERNEPTDESQKQQQLSKSVQKQLSESQKSYTQRIKRNQSRVLFDNSAGFLETGVFDVGGADL